MLSALYFYFRLFFDHSICLRYFKNIQKPKMQWHFATLNKHYYQLSNEVHFTTEKWWTSVQDNSPKIMSAIMRGVESPGLFSHFTTHPRVRSYASQLTSCSHLHL